MKAELEAIIKIFEAIYEDKLTPIFSKEELKTIVESLGFKIATLVQRADDKDANPEVYELIEKIEYLDDLIKQKLLNRQLRQTLNGENEMTKTQVKKLLTSNGYNLDSFEIKTGEVEMLPVYDEDGDLDYDATEEKAEKIGKLLSWGGYRCRYGGWVFQKD